MPSNRRWIPGIASAVLVSFCIFSSAAATQIAIFVISAFALFEFYRLFHVTKSFQGLGYLANFIALGIFWWKSSISVYPIAGLLFACFLVHLMGKLYNSCHPERSEGSAFKADSSAYGLGMTGSSVGQSAGVMLGFLLISQPLVFAMALRRFSSGAWWLFFPVATAALSDTAAYFIGKKFGKRKLAPRISPGKTIEGSLAGMLFAWLAAMLFGEILRLPWSHRLLLGLLLGLAAISGDLVESWMKRKAGAKDSGALLAGHGGILDRMDSHLFTILAVYLYYSLFISF